MNKANPMELDELHRLLDKITTAMQQMRDAMNIADNDVQRGLVATLYTKALIAKLQVKADLVRLIEKE